MVLVVMKLLVLLVMVLFMFRVAERRAGALRGPLALQRRSVFDEHDQHAVGRDDGREVGARRQARPHFCITPKRESCYGDTLRGEVTECDTLFRGRRPARSATPPGVCRRPAGG